ncbi:MAG: winged helix DNA-binding domain-containing protein [Acidimicrobiales bacterium]
MVLHATDPATIYLAVHARAPEATVAAIDDAMFERRSMLRTLAMRRTLFVATNHLLAAVERSSSVTVAATERKRLQKFLAESGIADPADWLSAVFQEVLDVLADHPEGLPARELTKVAPVLGTRILMGAGTKNAVEAGATSRVLGLMAVEGQIVRGRPTGDWTSRTYRWHRRDSWWPDGDPVESVEPFDEPQASIELLTRWLARFGPATIEDMKWWTGWTVSKTKRTLAGVDTVEVELEVDVELETEVEVNVEGTSHRETGFVLADDAEPVEASEPWAALLPALDPTAMGWKQRGWYLGDHRLELFDRNGNIGPTVWADGRIVGGWSQRPDGEVVTELLEPVGTEQQRMIDERADAVAAFVGSTVVKPSFPTPLQKRLSAG